MKKLITTGLMTAVAVPFLMAAPAPKKAQNTPAQSQTTQTTKKARKHKKNKGSETTQTTSTTETK